MITRTITQYLEGDTDEENEMNAFEESNLFSIDFWKQSNEK